jgi:hypothetical protein
MDEQQRDIEKKRGFTAISILDFLLPLVIGLVIPSGKISNIFIIRGSLGFSHVLLLVLVAVSYSVTKCRQHRESINRPWFRRICSSKLLVRALWGASAAWVATILILNILLFVRSVP